MDELDNAHGNVDAISIAQMTMRSNGVCQVKCVRGDIWGEVTTLHSSTVDCSPISNAISMVVLALAAEHDMMLIEVL